MFAPTIGCGNVEAEIVVICRPPRPTSVVWVVVPDGVVTVIMLLSIAS